MCPDSQLLSIYLDGELPSPWKEKMESHLEECSECRKNFKNLRLMQEFLKKETSQRRVYVEKAEAQPPEEFALSEHELMEEAKERVWRKLETDHRFLSGALISQKNNIRKYNVLKRRISIPLPLAAAAALILAFFIVFWSPRGGSANNKGAYQAASTEETPQIMAAGDLNSVLEYLGVDRSEVIILQLPESGNFSRSGDPAIIRSADYTGR